LDCTPEHKFYTLVNGNTNKVNAENLKEGDSLLLGNLPEFKASKDVSHSAYDFTHGYLMGKSFPVEADKLRIDLYDDSMQFAPLLDYPDETEIINKGHVSYVYNRNRFSYKVPSPARDGLRAFVNWFNGILAHPQPMFLWSVYLDYIKIEGAFTQYYPIDLFLPSVSNLAEVKQDLMLSLQELGLTSVVSSHGNNDIKLGIACNDFFKLLGFGVKLPSRSGITTPINDKPTEVKVTKVSKPYRVSDTYCFKEPKRHLGMFNGVLTGQCSEIIEYSDKDQTAVCNLGSLSLPAFVSSNGYDFEALHRATKILTNNLNKVIDVTSYPIPTAKVSNKQHRPIGIGVQGLADVFCMLKYPFESQEAIQLNRDIFETIYHGAMEASLEIAKKDGCYSSFEGSPLSQGKFQFDLWNVTPSNRYDWDALRKEVVTHGVRNSLLVAPMPTASTSQILGNNECFEPYTSNLYTRRVLAGEYVVVNKHLVKDLIKLGLWNDTLKQKLIANYGSVQSIHEVPDNLKSIYKTVWEIKQKTIIDMSADRGAFVCQSQSLNIHIANPTVKTMSSLHIYGWKKGLKTGMYYLRSKPASQAIQFTVDKTVIEPKVCSILDPTCESCSG
jgi:ribonucleotide reductase alpha subunit